MEGVIAYYYIYFAEKETEAWHGNYLEQGSTGVISELGIETWHCGTLMALLCHFSAVWWSVPSPILDVKGILCFL